MGKEVVIEFEIKNPKLISINEQYIHPVRKAKSGRYYSYFAKSDYLKEVQAYYKEVLKDKIPDDKIKLLSGFVDCDKSNGISLTIEVGMPLRDIRDNDISNYIKALEDCIVTRTKIDDSRDYEIVAKKSRYESEDFHMMVKITMSTYQLTYYEVLEDEDQYQIRLE